MSSEEAFGWICISGFALMITCLVAYIVIELINHYHTLKKRNNW